MKISRTKQIFILCVVLLVALLIAQYVAYVFVKKEAVAVATTERNIESLQSQVNQFSKYSSNDLLGLATSINARFIPHGDFVGFIEKIESAARSQKISIATRSVDVQQISDDINNTKELLRLKIETKGSWVDTMRFINFLEYLPYKITIKELDLGTTISDGSSKNTGTVWKAQIDLTALKIK